MLTALECVVVLASLAAAACDARTRRIPNVLCATLVALGIAVQSLAGGVPGAAAAVALVLAVIVVGSFAHAHGWLGGGDVKLVAGCAAYLGPQCAPDFLLFTAFAGGLLAIIMAARERRVATVFGNLTYGLLHGGGRIPTSASAARVPYAVAICSGLLVTLALRHLPSMRLTL